MSKIRIRKRGNTYSYSFDISKNPRRIKEKGGFATEDDAFDAGVKAYTDWKSGNIGITSARVKLRDYLASWLENVVRPNVKRTTFKSYHNAIGSRITPQIGDIYLQELRPRDIDLWVNELAHAGLSQGTIRQTKTVLSIALKYAIYPAELITANPTTGINIPRSAPHKVVMRTIITPEQFAAIPESNKYYPLLKILYHTGLRISEALGLTRGMISTLRRGRSPSPVREYKRGILIRKKQKQVHGHFMRMRCFSPICVRLKKSRRKTNCVSDRRIKSPMRARTRIACSFSCQNGYIPPSRRNAVRCSAFIRRGSPMHMRTCVTRFTD